jgi:NitT/TauT family transport system substrate-binding protein
MNNILHRDFVLRLSCILALLCVISVSLDAQTQKRLTIYGLKGSPGVALIRLFEQTPQAAGYEIRVEALAQADLLAALFISGEAKIGILPPNVAAKIASTGRKIQIAAVTGNGMLSLLSADTSVKRIEDLRGKTVEVAGQGATPDFLFRKILLSYGIRPDHDVHLGYALAHAEIAQALIAERIKLALIPEPFATTALAGNPRLSVIGNIQEEWRRLEQKTTGRSVDNYPMTTLVVDAAFAAENRILVNNILDRVKDSIEWVRANPEAAGNLAQKHELGLRAAVLKDAIPKSNYVFIPLPQARPALEALFGAFLEFAPASIGGALPKDDFYYNYGTP